VTYVARFPHVRIDPKKDEFVKVERASIAVCLGADPRFLATRVIHNDDFAVNPLLTSPRTGLAR